MTVEVVEVPLANGKGVALIDTDDADLILRHSWYLDGSRPHSYAATSLSRPGGGQRTMSMHRMILDDPAGLQVDHINHDGLDNRRQNLRLATWSENQANRRKQAGLSSRFRGVSWDKQRRVWIAQIRGGGRKRRLGRFRSEVAAARAYDSAASEIWGEFALLNFPAEGGAP